MVNIFLSLFWSFMAIAFLILSIHTQRLRKNIHGKLQSIKVITETGQLAFPNLAPLEEIVRDILIAEIVVFLLSIAAAIVGLLGAV